MDSKQTIKSVTFIIAGSLLGTFNSIGGGWASSATAIIGYAFLFQGLKLLKDALDEQGQAGVKMLTIGAIIGVVGFVIDLIPLIGFVARIVLLVAFIFELIGYLRLKKSETIGEIGQKGVQLILIYMILVIAAVAIGFIPLAGTIVSSVLSIAGLVLLLLGWTKVQEGLVK